MCIVTSWSVFPPKRHWADRAMSVSISACMLAASVPSLLVYWLMNEQIVTRFVLAVWYRWQSGNIWDACYHLSTVNCYGDHLPTPYPYNSVRLMYCKFTRASMKGAVVFQRGTFCSHKMVWQCITWHVAWQKFIGANFRAWEIMLNHNGRELYATIWFIVIAFHSWHFTLTYAGLTNVYKKKKIKWKWKCNI